MVFLPSFYFFNNIITFFSCNLYGALGNHILKIYADTVFSKEIISASHFIVFYFHFASCFRIFTVFVDTDGEGSDWDSTALWICSPQRFGIQVTIRAHNVLIGLMLPHSVEEFVWSHHSVDLF